MNANQVQIVGFAAAFLVIALTGYRLSRAGKPYGTLILTAHKLVSVGALVYLIVILVRFHRAAGLRAAELRVGIVTGLLFLTLLATGGVLSSDVRAPSFVARVHQIAPYLTMLSAAATLYLL
jgi:hypothetical protein